MARTPREAKQEFLNELIAEMRKPFDIPKDKDIATFTWLKEKNRVVIKAVAAKHGLYIPPQEI